jgi:hypothetical protein
MAERRRNVFQWEASRVYSLEKLKNQGYQAGKS